ncbi:MAG: acyltransferase domain-containing protein [Polyangiaceae bacterium]
MKADRVGGHSFGEVSALHAAGVFDAESLVRIARRRGELMRDAAAVPGAMIAVTKTAAEVEAWLKSFGTTVVIANHNAPTQVVLSGSVSEIEKVEKALEKDGIPSKRLPVATAFHSSLVAPSSGPLREFLAGVEVNAPSFDVYGNADASLLP